MKQAMSTHSARTRPNPSKFTMSDLVWVAFGVACSQFVDLGISSSWWVSLLVSSACGAIVGIVIAMVMRAAGIQVFKS